VISIGYDHELLEGFKGASRVPCLTNNYATIYCTSIMLAHHLLKKFELDEDYFSNETTICEHFNVEEGTKGNGPFTAFIDVGLMKLTTNNVKVCGALMVHWMLRFGHSPL
jgi:hypothetical protein